MKKLIFALVLLFNALAVNAFYVGGLDYYPTTNGCEVRGFAPNHVLSPEMTLTIPDYVTNSAGQTYKVTHIASDAFKGYTEIKNLVLGPMLESVGAGAFQSCINLQEAIFASSTKSIGEKAFYGCLSLKTLVTNAEIIGAHAFQGCISLAAVYLGYPMKYIEPAAFKGCTTLTNIDIPWSVVQISNGTAYTDSEGAFEDCLSLMSVTFSYNLSDKVPNLRRIGNSTFKNCISLSRIDFPYSVEVICQDAFKNCAELKHIELGGPKKLELLINDFYGIPLKRLVCHGDIDVNNTSLINVPELKEVRFDTYATIVPNNLFRDCTSLKEVHLDNVETIAQSAFSGCTSLAEINLSQVKTFYSSAFYNCSSLTAVDLSVAERIDISCFKNCTSLKSVTLGGSLTSINSVFDMTGIEALYIPDNVTSITQNNIPSLKRVEIGNGVSRLSCFQNCDALTSLKAGNKISSIKVRNPNLTSLTLGNPNPPAGDVYNDLYDQCKLIIPEGATEAYKTSNPWKNFYSIEESAEASQGVPPGKTGVETIRADNKDTLEVEISEGNLNIKTEATTMIYTLDGRRIKTIGSGNHNIPLTKGLYIVVSGSKSVKVAI